MGTKDAYKGPISLLKEAYEETESLGSTTVLLAALDNSTRIHGKLHPMLAVVSIGACQLLMLRRTTGRQGLLQSVFSTWRHRPAPRHTHRTRWQSGRHVCYGCTDC